MEEPLGSPPAALSALEKNVAELTVMDVYDIASLVGHEFERVIDQHGCESIARLMPKVVRVLEILEVLVSRHHVAPELDELRLELDRLRVERMDRIEKERKHQKELELVEDVWRGEAQDLLSQIAQLQEENKQLMTNLNHKDVGFSEEEFQKQEGMSERERQVMKRLKEVVDKQRDELRAKDRELGLKNEDVEALQQQQTRLMKINHDLRHRVTVVEAQGKALIEQKVELEADLQTKEQEMGSLRAELGKLRERLQGEHSQNGEEEEAEIQPQPDGEESISDAEKAALDLKDPNRPRFTLQELRDVLHERNELKSKVFLLQEELAYYKSEEIEEENRIPQPPPITHPRTSPQPESGIKRLKEGPLSDGSGELSQVNLASGWKNILFPLERKGSFSGTQRSKIFARHDCNKAPGTGKASKVGKVIAQQISRPELRSPGPMLSQNREHASVIPTLLLRGQDAESNKTVSQTQLGFYDGSAAKGACCQAQSPVVEAGGSQS